MNLQLTVEKLQPVKENLANSFHLMGPALKEFLVNILAQVRVWRKIYPGVMHALLFWGVTTQVVGTAINLMQMQLFIPMVELPFPREGGYLAYELIMDLAGIAILVGVLMAAFRRIIIRPKTLETRWDDTYALVLLAFIPIVGFSLEGLRLIAVAPEWGRWSPLGSLVASLYKSLGLTPDVAVSLHPYFFWTHALLGLSLVASIPFTKLRHLIQTPLNILLRSRRKSSVLEKIENINEVELLGVGQVNEFTPQQLLSLDACTRCGRCEEVCPSVISGMELSPKKLIQNIRLAKVKTLESPNGHTDALIGETVPENWFWSCTTCGACLVTCPGFVNPVDEVIDLRRYQVLTTGKIPKSVADVLRNLERQGNPWGMSPDEKAKWLDELGVRQLNPGDETDVLFFIGCAGSLDDRNKKATQAFVQLIQKSGMDVATLGSDENCCGETARRLGHEYLFQMLADQNIATLSNVKFKRIVTQCPHCYNTLKNEYPQMGGNYHVMHSSELLCELNIISQSTSGNGKNQAITFHDPCYLGRHNHIFQPPRALLGQAGLHVREMTRKYANSVCCGGGGGQMWMETDAETRINQRRLQDALETGSKTIATACPYCLLMFDDAIRSKGLGDEIQVKDLSEILVANTA
jgi:Fe-S oxidoreductase/nitrate reductase gamma subunit